MSKSNKNTTGYYACKALIGCPDYECVVWALNIKDAERKVQPKSTSFSIIGPFSDPDKARHHLAQKF